MLTCNRCGRDSVVYHIYFDKVVGSLDPEMYKCPEDLIGEDLDLKGVALYCKDCGDALWKEFKVQEYGDC